jgi:acetyl-CoA acyltransferase
VPGLDPREIGDVVVGCAMPEAEQGMNVARIGLLLAGLPQGVPGITINRFCSSGLQAVAIAADRIRLGEADVMIAAGTESMSMMPQMMGNKISLNPADLREGRERRHRLRHGPHRREGGAAVEGVREDQDAFAVQSATSGLRRHRRGQVQGGDLALRRARPSCRISGAARCDRRARDRARRRPAPRFLAAEGLAKLGRCSPRGLGHRRQQLADVRRRRCRAADVGSRSSASIVKPIARFRSFAVAGVPPEIMGIGPSRRSRVR